MSPKKTRIITEQVKDKHTSHWDLDMLSREELEKLMVEDATTEADSSVGNTAGNTETSDSPTPAEKDA